MHPVVHTTWKTYIKVVQRKYIYITNTLEDFGGQKLHLKFTVSSQIITNFFPCQRNIYRMPEGNLIWELKVKVTVASRTCEHDVSELPKRNFITSGTSIHLDLKIH